MNWQDIATVSPALGVIIGIIGYAYSKIEASNNKVIEIMQANNKELSELVKGSTVAIINNTVATNGLTLIVEKLVNKKQ